MDIQHRVERLSGRQREVLALVAKGLTNNEIGTVLGISPTTVRTHVTAILGLLEVTNRTEATGLLVGWEAGPERVERVLARPAIVVLPLTPLGDEPRVRAVADGVTSDLGCMFARYCWFPVIAQSSVSRDDAGVSSTTAGARLGARFLVGGTLRLGKTGWRLVVHVDDAETHGARLWSERYDFSDEDLFAVLDDIVEVIVATAYPVLISHTATPISACPSELGAWELAHAGMGLRADRGRESNHRAQTLFNRALERDPTLVLAHFGLGLASYDALLNQWGPLEEARERIASCGERCLALAPHSAEGHFLLARYAQSHGNPASAQIALENAVARNPSFATAHALLAQVLQFTGDPDGAMRRMQHAVRLGPRSFVAGLATLHFLRSEYTEALDGSLRALAATPRYPYALALAAASACLLGDSEQASALHLTLERDHPNFQPSIFAATYGPALEGVLRFERALETMQTKP